MPTSAAQRRTAFKELIAAPGPLVLPGAYDPFSAQLVERAGFPATYLGSFAAAAGTFGLPDLGLVTLTELVEITRRVVDATNLPVLVDGEKGFYEAASIWRAVQAFESAGAVGIHIEDNLGGKHTGHPAGLLDIEQMTTRIRAALDSREDPNFLIIGRTDAAYVYGDIDETVRRLESYAAAGADLVFAPKVSAEVLKRIRSRVDAPVIIAADLYDAPDGSRPGSTLADYADAGADVLLLWYSLIGAAAKGVRDTLQAVKKGTEIADLPHLILDQHEFESFMGYADYEERATRYA
jgi:2-methylisocitrate lyase-like PEP mutase family enzyme